MDNEIINEHNSASSKLSKIGRRIRDSCRQHLRGKHPSGGAASNNPEDYGNIPAPNDSGRSRQHYVPMDFSSKSARIVTANDMPGKTTKEGYTYFRRKIEPQNVDHLLTDTQTNIHKDQSWFHKGVGRDLSQKILASHSVDGLFLVRESSVQGGFVISYYFNGRAYHAPVMPFTHPTTSAVSYSLDDGKTKFYDLLQLVEFYQLNKASLCTKLTHFVINKISSERSSSPTESSDSCKHASDVSLDSSKEASTDDNHNSKGTKGSSKGSMGSLGAMGVKEAMEASGSEDERSVTTAVDANMASEDETDRETEERYESMKEDH